MMKYFYLTIPFVMVVVESEEDRSDVIIEASHTRRRLNTECPCDNGRGRHNLLCGFNTLRNQHCESCDSGFHKEDMGSNSMGFPLAKCVANRCYCNNGTKGEGASCIGNGRHICVSCNSGYHQKGEFCAANQCNCSNGKKAEGASCTGNGKHICVSCNSGYRRDGYKCTATTKSPKPQPSNTTKKPKPQPSTCDKKKRCSDDSDDKAVCIKKKCAPLATLDGGSCFEIDVAYNGGNIGDLLENVDSPTSCQQECHKEPTCNFFTWTENKNTCRLKYATGNIVRKDVASKKLKGRKVSGSRNCDCINFGAVYKGKKIKLFEGITNSSDCHGKCQENDKCGSWVWNIKDKKCSLKENGDITNMERIKHEKVKMSGTKKCDNECDATICYNGGTCHPDDQVTKCNCPEGFGGDFCEDATTEATTPPKTTPSPTKAETDCTKKGFRKAFREIFKKDRRTYRKARLWKCKNGAPSCNIVCKKNKRRNQGSIACKGGTYTLTSFKPCVSTIKKPKRQPSNCTREGFRKAFRKIRKEDRRTYREARLWNCQDGAPSCKIGCKYDERRNQGSIVCKGGSYALTSFKPCVSTTEATTPPKTTPSPTKAETASEQCLEDQVLDAEGECKSDLFGCCEQQDECLNKLSCEEEVCYKPPTHECDPNNFSEEEEDECGPNAICEKPIDNNGLAKCKVIEEKPCDETKWCKRGLICKSNICKTPKPCRLRKVKKELYEL